jgi:hypothetical protein
MQALASAWAQAQRLYGLFCKNGRRGRLSRDEYAFQVCAVMRIDAFKLEERVAFGQMPDVKLLARRSKKSAFPNVSDKSSGRAQLLGEIRQ